MSECISGLRFLSSAVTAPITRSILPIMFPILPRSAYPPAYGRCGAHLSRALQSHTWTSSVLPVGQLLQLLVVTGKPGLAFISSTVAGTVRMKDMDHLMNGRFVAAANIADHRQVKKFSPPRWRQGFPGMWRLCSYGKLFVPLLCQVCANGQMFSICIFTSVCDRTESRRFPRRYFHFPERWLQSETEF